MFGVSDHNVLTRDDRWDQVPDGDRQIAKRIVYNDVDPFELYDGVEVVWVVPKTDVRFEMYYQGGESGYMLLNHDGTEELGGTLLENDGRVPAWLLDPSTVDLSSLPAWIPDGFEPPQTVVCDRCDREIHARHCLVPGRTEYPEVCCTSCWRDVRESPF